MEAAELLRAHTLDQRRRGLQESTIYKRNLLFQRFGDWLATKSMLAATSRDINQFLDSCRINSDTRGRYLSALKVFYTWAVGFGLLDHDPTTMIPRPKIHPGLPRPISDDDLDQALQASAGPYRVMYALAAFEGMRCVEIARLTREDILDDRDPPMIVAHGKGDKPRLIPLHGEAWKALLNLGLPHTGPVLRAPDGQAYPAWKISHLGNAFLHAVGVAATMHQLRHWFGTGIYRSSGHDLLLAKDLMGHESVETTRVYAAFDRAGAAAAVAGLNVKAHIKV